MTFENSQTDAFKTDNFPKPVVASGISRLQIVDNNQIHSLQKFGEDTTVQTWMVVNYLKTYKKLQKTRHNMQPHLECLYIKI